MAHGDDHKHGIVPFLFFYIENQTIGLPIV